MSGVMDLTLTESDDDACSMEMNKHASSPHKGKRSARRARIIEDSDDEKEESLLNRLKRRRGGYSTVSTTLDDREKEYIPSTLKKEEAIETTSSLKPTLSNSGTTLKLPSSKETSNSSLKEKENYLRELINGVKVSFYFRNA